MKVSGNPKKLLLIALNSKIGMKLILDCYSKYFSTHFNTIILAERSYQPIAGERHYGITDASSHLAMAKDTLNLFIIYRLFMILNKEKPDICYFISAHPLNPIAIMAIRFIEKLSGKKITITSHIHDVFPHKNTKNYILIDLFQKWQIGTSNKLTVYGETLKREIISRFHLSPEIVLSTPHGTNRFNDQLVCPKGTNKKYISFLGRIDIYKGIDTFLNVAKHFEERNDIIFYLGGEGDLNPYRSKIRSLKNLRLENRFLSNEEMDRIMYESYLVLLPYIEASQSGVIPVAYYNCCPVIVTNVGGLIECVVDGKTGFIVEPRDVDKMVEKISLIINDGLLRERLGEECFIYYQKDLRWVKILEKVAGFIAE